MNLEKLLTIVVLIVAQFLTQAFPNKNNNNVRNDVRRFNKGIKMLTATFEIIFDGVLEESLEEYFPNNSHFQTLFTFIRCILSASSLTESLLKTLLDGVVSPKEILTVLKKGEFIIRQSAALWKDQDSN
mmetsp:Transcript_7589/g.11589  ORF Transcript_7589/g.11589 Transcript_7589/m.11589 type:complete len:129 (+) Transcript_7589:54-440(+)